MFALAMGWGGCIFDLTIIGWLLWRKTRPYAYAVLIFFHTILWLMFPIGVFPWLMVISASIFFPPSWCMKWFPLTVGGKQSRGTQFRAAQFLAVTLFCALQCMIPLRHILYPGPVNWTEEGFRFSWRVMLIEKAGSLEYEVHKGDQRFFVFPRKELPPFQYRMLTTQPDMIHDYALELAKRYSAEDGESVQVYARSVIWFNGRKSQPYIDPNIDLAAEDKGFHHKSWILPLGFSLEDKR